MKPLKLTAVVSLTVLSVYVISRLGSIPFADAGDATQVTPKQMAPGVSTGIQPRLLNTGVMQPTAAQLAAIQAGTFTSNNAYLCPAVPNCGTPNTPPPSPATTCPDVCFVKAANIGNPSTFQPYSYTQCPSGYAALAIGKSDITYQWAPADNKYPTSQADMQNLQTQSYACTDQPTDYIDECPAPGGNVGDYVIRGGTLWHITWAACTSTAAGTWCYWTVSCGVANVWKISMQHVRCTRPAGYYPVVAAYSPGTGSYYQTAPTSTICGHVKTQWGNG